MKTAFGSKFGSVSPGMKHVILHAQYRELTNDASAPTNLNETEINERMEDADIVVDLRHLNSGRKTCYNVFWSECKKFLNEVMIGDMEVSHTWPKRFQYVIFVSKYKQNALMEEPLFYLNHGYACSSGRKLSMPGLRYTTLEGLMFDSWYRPDSFLRHTQMSTMQQNFFMYQRELAVLLRDHNVFVSLDDKHQIKVGEPQFPVAVAEHGRRVLISCDTTFEVGDHDFTCMSIVLSVCFITDNPESVKSSWYTGKVLIG